MSIDLTAKGALKILTRVVVVGEVKVQLMESELKRGHCKQEHKTHFWGCRKEKG